MKDWHYIISEKCNMKCTYCNVDVNNNIRLDKEFFLEFKKTIEETNEDYTFSIFGGEPFLQVDIIKFIVSQLENDPHLILMKITTNGTIYNKEVDNIIKHDKMKVTLSYDGLKQIPHRGTHKLYIKELLKSGVRSGHCMITGNDFDEDNENYIINLHKSLEDVKLKPDITIVRDVGSWDDVQVNNFKKAFTNYIKFITSLILENEYKIFSDLPGLVRTYLNSILEYHIKNNKQNDCSCGINHFAILPNKKILPCERFDRDDSTLSKLKNKELILKDCVQCDIRNYCHKGCIYEQLKNNGVIPELCAIYKHIIHELKQQIKDTEHILLKLFTKENL